MFFVNRFWLIHSCISKLDSMFFCGLSGTKRKYFAERTVDQHQPNLNKNLLFSASLSCQRSHFSSEKKTSNFQQLLPWLLCLSCIPCIRASLKQWPKLLIWNWSTIGYSFAFWCLSQHSWLRSTGFFDSLARRSRTGNGWDWIWSWSKDIFRFSFPPLQFFSSSSTSCLLLLWL